MLDAAARRVLAGPLDRTAAALDRSWCSPDRLTLTGLVLGVGAAVAAWQAAWWPALVLWLGSRIADGLDGPLARRRARHGRPTSDAGGFLDIGADFVCYGTFVVGVGVGSTTDGGSLLPFLVVLLAYYLNGSLFLAFSSIAERTGHRINDGRSLSFLGGLAEGTETVVVHALWCLLPAYAGTVAWVWAIVVLISATQRLVGGYRILRTPSAPSTKPRLPPKRTPGGPVEPGSSAR